MSGSDKPRRRARQIDVAIAANVSQATVSLVLGSQDDARISAETRQHVLEVGRRLGYSINPAARALAGGTNQLIGVFTFESAFPIDGNDRYYPLLVGIEAEAARLGQNIVLFTRAATNGNERSLYANGINQIGLADGTILLGYARHQGQLRQLATEGYPFVHIGRREIEGCKIAWVTADYASATFQVVEHLWTLGHRRIAYLSVPDPDEADNDRLSGWKAALKAKPISGTIDRAWSGKAIPLPDRIKSLYERGTTALVVERSQHGTTVIDAVSRAGLNIPNDISVAVLGDMTAPHQRTTDWTCFRMPFQVMGSEAVRHLFELISNASTEPKHILVPCVFSPGATSGKLRRNLRPRTGARATRPDEAGIDEQQGPATAASPSSRSERAH